MQEQQQRQQRQEVATDAIREGEGDNDDVKEQRGKQGEKRRHQDRTEEVSNDIQQSEGSDCSHNTNDEDVEDDEDNEEPQPAKRRKLPSAPTHEGLPQPHSLTPPSATQLEVTSRCDNQPESQKSSSPFPTGDEEPTSNTGAAYQEWPMCGFFKIITIGNEVCYGIEFSLEDVQQLLRRSISSAYVIG